MSLKPSAIKGKCGPVVKKLMDAEFGWIFHQPVDPITLGLPDYFEIVKRLDVFDYFFLFGKKWGWPLHLGSFLLF